LQKIRIGNIRTTKKQQELIIKYKDIIDSIDDFKKLSLTQLDEIRTTFISKYRFLSYLEHYTENLNDITVQRNALVEKYKNIIHSRYDLRKLSPLQKSEIRKVFPNEIILYHMIEQSRK
jgi:hypothetical protein